METDNFVGSARRARVVLLAVVLVFTGAACKSGRSRVTVQNEEQPAEKQLLSTIKMNDAAAAPQLLRGFYGVENNAWRWTSGKFSVLLRTPPAAQNGATFTLGFSVPEGSISKLGKLKLTASVKGTQLASAEYSKPGAYMLTADVPASLLSGDTVTIDFELDKTMRVEGDNRDLGLVAASISLTAK